MSDLFLHILNTGLSAAWVILAVMAARLLLKKAPRWLVCGLWAIVAVYLLSPISIEAPFSLVPSAEIIPPESLLDAAPEIHSGVSIIDNAVNPGYTESFRPDGFSSVNPLQIWVAVFANLWLLGVLAMDSWALFSWLRIRKRTAEAIPSGGVWLCDGIDTPFILGLIRPRIYLPSGMNEADATHVIAHEQAHLKRHDHWWKPLGYLLLSVFWFQPLLWIAYILLCRDIELACDEKVIGKLDLQQKKDYSSALLRCSIPRRMIAACPLAFGEVGVKTRIKGILNYKKPAFWVVLIALIIAIVLAVCFLTDPVERTPEIRYNGVLYLQDGPSTTFIPDKLQSESTLDSVLHRTSDHPDQERQATNLSWEYAGCKFYTVGEVLYLEEPGGETYLPFRMRTPVNLLSELLRGATVNHVTVRTGDIVETEELLGDRGVAMSMVLDDLRHTGFTPGSLAGEAVLSVTFTRSGGQEPAVTLNRDPGGGWELVIDDKDYGESRWLFSCDALDAQVQRYLDRAAVDDAQYEDPVMIDYKTFTNHDTVLRAGIPAGWTAEQKGNPDSEGVAVRIYPNGSDGGSDGFVQFEYRESSAYTSNIEYLYERFTFPNGISGQGWCDPRTGKWETIHLDTTKGQLLYIRQHTSSWTTEQLQTAETIISSITLFSGGVNLMANANRLGITLTVENPTPSGLSLLCTQNGTYWDAIYTGSPYHVWRWEDGDWVLQEFPDNLAWTMEAIGIPLGDTCRFGINWSQVLGSLEPGHYRIGKAFSGEIYTEPDRQTFDQTLFAEFDIE